MTTGQTSLGKIGIVNKGNYSPDVTYNQCNFVFYKGSTWLALKDGLLGVEPVEGENWKYLARGIPENIQEQIDFINDNKSSIFIGETLPPTQERKKNTVYYRIIEKLDTGFVTENIKVSPKMGIKLVNN